MVTRNILIIDDHDAIHDDFARILAPPESPNEELDSLRDELFSPASASKDDGDDSNSYVAPARERAQFALTHARQGQQALELVEESLRNDAPFSVAFVDMRMPPGWDGHHTVQELWKVDPRIQVVFCSAYSDTTYEELLEGLPFTESFIIIKKPFDAIEVLQAAHSLSAKWASDRAVEQERLDLAATVKSRTKELESALVNLAKETAEREKMESELRLSQKLEAVGQLAAGVAHEINTPMQFIGDSLFFVEDAMGDVMQFVEGAVSLDAVQADPLLFESIEEMDLDYLKDALPAAFSRIKEGVSRVVTIVKAMKEFGHTDQREKSPADLNHALQSTLVIASNEYRYVADVECDYDAAIPHVPCFVADLNQVFLNLIVNASHAIADRQQKEGTDRRGTIQVRTQARDGGVEIAISDDGCGIPDDVISRIFDPFFTTKEVGRGTGQGLAITHNILVEKHGGNVDVTSEVGAGSCFTLFVPGAPARDDSPQVEGAACKL